MRTIYILIVLVVTASALGCIGNKQNQTSTQTSVSPEQTSVSPGETSASSGSVASVPGPSGTASENDAFGTESDIASMDSLTNDSNMDITLSNSI